MFSYIFDHLVSVGSEGISRPDEVKSVIYFTDNAPEGLSNSLASLRHATKVSQSSLQERNVYIDIEINQYVQAWSHCVLDSIHNGKTCNSVQQ